MSSTTGGTDATRLGQAWFFLSGAAGTFFFPFVPVFLSSRGMGSVELGVLSAMRPWVAAPTALFATALADRLRLHSTILVTCLIASTVLRASLPLLGSGIGLAAALLVSEVVGAPCGVIADSTILSNAKSEGDYGRLRLWASIGAVISSLAAGSLISRLGINMAFVAYAALSLPLFWLAARLKYNYRSGVSTAVADGAGKQQEQAVQPDAVTSPGVLADEQQQATGISSSAAGGDKLHQRPRNAGAAAEPAGHAAAGTLNGSSAAHAAAGTGRQQAPGVLQLLSNPQALVFLLRCLVMGIGFGVIQTFEFLFLKQLGAPETLMGMAIMVSCCAEVPAFQLSGRLIQRLGITAVLDMAHLLLAVRLAVYSLLPLFPSLWLVLPVELLQGVTFACGWNAATVQAGRLAPPELAATMQGVFQATYLGVGAGLGGLIGGALMEQQGGQALFKWASVGVLAGWAAVQAAEMRLRSGRRRQRQAGAKPHVA